MPHQAPIHVRRSLALTQDAAPRSPASCGGTQVERKNYSELVTIVQNIAGRWLCFLAAVKCLEKRHPGKLGQGRFIFALLIAIRDDDRCQSWRRGCNGSTSALGTNAGTVGGPHG